MDVVFAIVLILILLPLIILISLLVLVFLKHPVLFKQVRTGKHTQPFTIYKFRTMLNLHDDNGKLLPDEQRMHYIGNLIRKLSLDEIPQLFNVLKGDMSFIGPRPLLPEYIDLYSEFQNRRHEVKPGITGWAQVNGRNAISWEQKFKFDVWYVDNVSFLLDMKIFLLTIIKVFQRKGINPALSATVEKFNAKN